jgi:hypothetical protein
MPILKTRCSEEMTVRFHALARGESLSAAMLLRRMVAAVVAQHGAGATTAEKSDTCGGRGGHGSRIMLGFYPDSTDTSK